MLKGWPKVADATEVASLVATLAALAEVESAIGLVNRHIANLIDLTRPANNPRIIWHGIDDLCQAAIQVGPPQGIALCPIELVAHRIDGDLQRLRCIDRQPADQHFQRRTIEVGAQDLTGLGVITLFHLAPVEFATAFIDGNVGDNLPRSLDDLHTILRVAQHGAFDGVGQAAIGIGGVGLGADIGDGLRRAHRATVTQFITGAGGHRVGLEARFDTLPVDAHQLVAGTGKGELGGVEVVAQLVVVQCAGKGIIGGGQVAITHNGGVVGLCRAA